MQETQHKAKTWEVKKLRLDIAVYIACTNFNDAGITSEMVLEFKIIRLGEIEADLRKKVTELEEQVQLSTPLEVLEERRHTTTEAMKNIEEVEVVCANVVDQVSQAWEALMDDAESKKIAKELTTVEANITQIRNEMNNLPLVQ